MRTFPSKRPSASLQVEKLKYSTSGTLINKVTDIFKGDDNLSLTRNTGYHTMIIENGHVVKTTDYIKFISLGKCKIKGSS